MTVEEIIKSSIDQMDLKEMVRYEIRSLIHDDVKRQIREVTKTEVADIIKTEIEISMQKGITTDDGWGNTEKFVSFEALFKKTFSENLKSKYEIQQLVKNHITSEVKKLVESKTKDITTALMESLAPTK